jgi:hypothetical protein
MAILPFLINKELSYFSDDAEVVKSIQSSEHRQWVLVTACVPIPMIVELILDVLQPSVIMRTDAGKTVDRNVVLCTALVLSSFFLPNFIFFMLLSMKDVNYARLASIQRDLVRPQITLIIGGMLCSMFDQNFTIAAYLIHLGISLEKLTTMNFFMIVLSQIFFLVHLSMTNTFLKQFFFLLYFIFIAIFVVLCIYIFYKLLLFLYRDAIATSFNFHNALTMRNFFNSITILTFVISIVLFGVITRQWYLWNYYANLSVEDLNGNLYIQILTIMMLQVVKGRMFIRAVKVKTDQLRTRLDLMRYISHEIRLYTIL